MEKSDDIEVSLTPGDSSCKGCGSKLLGPSFTLMVDDRCADCIAEERDELARTLKMIVDFKYQNYTVLVLHNSPTDLVWQMIHEAQKGLDRWKKMKEI